MGTVVSYLITGMVVVGSGILVLLVVALLLENEELLEVVKMFVTMLKYLAIALSALVGIGYIAQLIREFVQGVL